MALTVKMILDRETKGAVRYKEVDDQGKDKATDNENAVMGILYVRKKGFGQPAPAITVTIERS